MSTLPLSAIDTMKPALDRTRRSLFQPFRLGLWLRLALLAVLTGELSSGGGSPNGSFHVPANSGGAQGASAAALPFALPSLQRALPFIVAAAFVFVLLYFVFLYLSSVLRFVLFEAVVRGDVRLREGWRRWQGTGNSLFAWRVAYTAIVTAVDAVFIGLPIFAAWRAGVFRDPGQHLVLLIFGGFVFVVLALALLLAGIVVWVLTKDFVVPIMAAEGVGPVEGWRRLLPMLKASTGGYAGYVGFKAVLALAAGMIVGIIGIVLIVIMVIPAVIIGVLAGVAIPAGGAAWSAATITAIIVGVAVLIAVMLCVMSMLSVPVVVFFQSYSLHFLASRYEPLHALLFPPEQALPPVMPV